jgi:4-amino-4-deoxychorismate lyase
MAARILVNGVSADTVSATDRGLSYGDGLFESIRFVADAAPLWSRHMQRFAQSCRRLHLPMPEPELLLREAREVTRDLPQSVVRMTLTRGAGERGYALPASPQVTRVVAAFAPPSITDETRLRGVRMRMCDIRLAEQPLLAGMKHLNRLEQVLARAEWNDPAIDEGVLCDTHGRVISAIMANLFAVIDGVLTTPRLDRCGVAGVGRAEVLAVWPQAQELDLMPEALMGASEMFLVSSVRGILPVHSLGDRVYVPGIVTRKLQQHWRDLGISMEQGA